MTQVNMTLKRLSDVLGEGTVKSITNGTSIFTLRLDKWFGSVPLKYREYLRFNFNTQSKIITPNKKTNCINLNSFSKLSCPSKSYFPHSQSSGMIDAIHNNDLHHQPPHNKRQPPTPPSITFSPKSFSIQLSISHTPMTTTQTFCNLLHLCF